MIGFGFYQFCRKMGENGICVGVLVAVVWVVLGESGPGSGRVGFCYVCVWCESGLSV